VLCRGRRGLVRGGMDGAVCAPAAVVGWWCATRVGVEFDVGDSGSGSPRSLGLAIPVAVLSTVSALLPLHGLMVVAGFGFWVGHRRKPYKALAFASDDDVFHAVFLLGGATNCPSFLVAGSRPHARLARFFDGTRFSSWSLGTPALPSLCSSPPLSPRRL
jgi:hypothetical protein